MIDLVRLLIESESVWFCRFYQAVWTRSGPDPRCGAVGHELCERVRLVPERVVHGMAKGYG